MPSIPKALSHSIEYYLLRMTEKFISIIPRFFALKLGSFAGFIFFLSGIYKNTAVVNMKYTGLWSKKEIDTILFKLYRNMGRYMIDFLRSSPSAPPYRVHNQHLLTEVLSRKKGTIVLLAHIGNWEMLAEVFGKKLSDLNVIAKRMKNKKVDQWLACKRSSTGVITIYSEQALRKMLEVIKRNGIVAILIDQHAGKHGTMVPFLGKPANTVRSVAGIVQKTGCSVLPAYSLMDKDGTYDIIINEISEPKLEGYTEDQCIEEYQKLHNEIISKWIKEHPEHYFGWFHKRFRNLIPY
jgi:KDO2-lipid IV(A) lauroyltransferase